MDTKDWVGVAGFVLGIINLGWAIYSAQTQRKSGEQTRKLEAQVRVFRDHARDPLAEAVRGLGKVIDKMRSLRLQQDTAGVRTQLEQLYRGEVAEALSQLGSAVQAACMVRDCSLSDLPQLYSTLEDDIHNRLSRVLTPTTLDEDVRPRLAEACDILKKHLEGFSRRLVEEEQRLLDS